MYYAKMLGEKLRNDRINVWLVNTGWTGGCYGEGKRIDLHYTRAMVSAALNGDLEKVFYQTHRIFGIQIPMSCPGVFNRLLNPENAWADKAAYNNAAVKLAASFQMNFEQYSNFATDKFEKGGPVLAK
ncbi:hypothetical protein CTE07_13030 [Chitinophaga terrae (ex Kim and Jung 2007)]|nr:hypothetical protein CTE07_13030 [Chitinophaga terrae (ex Kim and Jung 2007)]